MPLNRSGRRGDLWRTVYSLRSQRARRNRIRLLLIVVPSLLLTLIISFLIHYLLSPVPTVFTAMITSTQLSFVTGKTPEAQNSSGLFASATPLDLTVIDCRDPRQEDQLDPAADGFLPCPEGHIALKGAALDTLRLPPRTQVHLSTEGGRLNFRVIPTQSNTVITAIVVSTPEWQARPGLSPQRWQVLPANLGLNFVLSTQSLSPESELSVEDNSISFDTRDGIPTLVGDKNTITFPLTHATVALSDNFLRLKNLSEAKILRLSIEHDGRRTNLKTLLTGRSNSIKVRDRDRDRDRDEDRDEDDLAFNHAKDFSNKQGYKGLVLLGTLLAAAFATLSILFTAIQTWYSARTHHKQYPNKISQPLRK